MTNAIVFMPIERWEKFAVINNGVALGYKIPKYGARSAILERRDNDLSAKAADENFRQLMSSHPHTILHSARSKRIYEVYPHPRA